MTDGDAARFLRDFDACLPEADAVAVSGSLPKGLPDDFYCEIIRRCRAAGTPVLVDTSGQRLISAVREKPDFIKPNTDEMEQLTGISLSGRAEYIRALRDLCGEGIPTVVLSMGAEGALLACGEGVFHGKPPKITPRNTVGCGDSMVAGFAVGYARKLSTAEAFRMALAVSAANALSLFTGDFDPSDYDRLYPEVSIEKIG